MIEIQKRNVKFFFYSKHEEIKTSEGGKSLSTITKKLRLSPTTITSTPLETSIKTNIRLAAAKIMILSQ